MAHADDKRDKEQGQAASPAHGEHGHGDHGHGHDHDHPSYLAHHFDTPEQQMDSEKLGMWLFLATEILLFGGLFVAYSWYRANHPEVFTFAHQLLDVKYGMINTLVLIFSSFTMAWAVRCAQLGQRKLMLGLLAVTVLCACAFMVVKAIEYTAKFEHGAVWGKSPAYDPAKLDHYVHGKHELDAHHAEAAHATEAAPAIAEVLPMDDNGISIPQYRDGVWVTDASNIRPAPDGPPGISYTPGGKHQAPAHHEDPALTNRPPNTHVFFGIYFAMTGLHGIHVLIGIIAILGIMFFGARGLYTPEYNTPVDLVGLYWHIVDLIWIFLFPLLYLIH